MKRIAIFFALMTFFCTCVHGIDVSAAGAVLYDPLSGQVLYQKNMNMRRGMASTTKIMTALVALDSYDVDETVTINKAWCGVEGSSIYLKAGEKLKILDIVYGMLLNSGNDAAQALACIKTGNSADFVKLMNEKANALALADTNFENPSGLDGENHYSTPYDMARLAANAMENPVFHTIVGTKNIKVGERYFSNHNKLLYKIEGATGIKTGFTKKCGRCLVSAVERNGRRLIAVTLAAPNDWADHENMYKYGFDEFSMKTLAKSGAKYYVKLATGNKNTTSVCLREDITSFVRASDQMVTVIVAPPITYAPVKSGDVYGTLHIKIGEKTVATGNLYFTENIEQQPIEKSFWQKLLDKIRLKN